MEKRNPHWLYCDDPSLTQQQFKDECDINLIIARVAAGGALTHLNERVAQYGDVSSIPDYRSSLDMVRRAEGMFMSLDANVRERFANDPGKFLDFVQDNANYDEAVKLGLVERKLPPVGSPPATAPVAKDDSGAKKSKAKADDD